jgi:small subunit ribosomal protein S16
VLVRSAGFQTCCVADFQVGRVLENARSAGLETRDTADLEVCVTVAVSRCAPHDFSWHSELDSRRSDSYFSRPFEIFMAVKIRMKRVGAKNAPFFRIVVADGRSPRDGRFIEEIGSYQPLKKGDNFSLKLDRAKYWLSKGAQPSETVASFLKKAGKATAA